jgi:membrane-bound serine protease (ClpP class)
MRLSNRLAASLFCLLATALLLGATAGAQPEDDKGADGFRVLSTDISASISPAQVDLLKALLQSAVERDMDMVLVRLNTPGGLGQSMRDMVQLILNSPAPVAVWVGPSGARAASAGVFLVAAADVAAMSPQSTIGSASPVAMGGKEIDETMAKKIKNDFLSLVRGIAARRGRNVDWYVKAVDESVNITASEAAMLNVIDFVASDREDLMSQVAAKGLQHGGRSIEIDAAKVSYFDYEPGLRYSVFSWLLDPQIAYLLLLGGMAGLFFELTNPGAILPGALGGICLLLGLYAMSVLPTNAAGLLLIIFGLVLFLLEIKIVSFGLLSVGGLVCFFIGSLILFDFEYGMQGLPMSMVIGTTLGMALVLGTAVVLVIKAHRRAPAQGVSTLIDRKAIVRNWSGSQGQVFLRGEVWSARSATEETFNKGDEVEVADASGLVLTVRRPG